MVYSAEAQEREGPRAAKPGGRLLHPRSRGLPDFPKPEQAWVWPDEKAFALPLQVTLVYCAPQE